MIHSRSHLHVEKFLTKRFEHKYPNHTEEYSDSPMERIPSGIRMKMENQGGGPVSYEYTTRRSAWNILIKKGIVHHILRRWISSPEMCDPIQRQRKIFVSERMR